MELNADRDAFDLAEEAESHGHTDEWIDAQWIEENPLPSRRFMLLNLLMVCIVCLGVWAAAIAGIVWAVKEVL